ncbi:MAG TPA: choice-of-anchor D domain-containing protein [Kofleriaceae bacterium]|nr:choice-of-anchor D domain-containing protein [Kofleriaceae bacterium]
MTIRRWAQLAAFVLLFFVTRNASAIVVGVCNSTNCSGGKTAAVGNVVVNATGTNSDVYLTSDTQNYNADLVISGCTGTGTGTFTARIGGASTNIQLKNNQNNVVDVAYTPTTRGGRSCTVNVYPAGTTTGSLGSFTITATGVAPVISTVASLAFGTVRYNDATPLSTHTATLNLQISNTGDAGQPLQINAITLTGAGAGDYAVSSTPALPATVNPGTPVTWVITFDPIAAGASSATINIDSTDPVTATKTVSVSGTGGTAVIGVTTAINFNTINQGTTSTTQNISVSNNGAGTKATMGVTQAALVNNTAGWFKFNQAGCVGSTTTCTLAMAIVGTPGTVGVQCAPPAGASGTQTASVQFTSDADDNSANTTSLSCTAGRADIVVTTTPLAFNNQLINTTSTGQTVMIQNTGNATLTYNVGLAGVDPTQFILTGAAGCTSGCNVSAMSSVLVTVQFRPTSVGAKNAVLRVSPTNDPDTAGPIDVGLSGTGIAPLAAYNVTSMAFGNIEVGATATAQTLTVTNNGTSDLTVSQAQLSAGATDYVVQTGTTGATISIVIPPTMTATWTIACKPTQQGSRAGTFHVNTDSNNTLTGQDIALSCNGQKGNLTITASSFDFMQKLEGSMTPQTFTLTNTGNLPVTNINYAMTGTGTGYSILSPTFPIASLGANASVTVTVQFYPLNGNDGGALTYTFSGVWGSGNVPTSTTLSLNGDGLTTGYDTSPSNPYPVDWGDIRFDTPTNTTLNIVNTAGTAYNIMSLSITPDMNTASSEIAIIQCRHNGVAAAATTNGCPAGTTYAPSSGANDTTVVTVQCKPNNRIGMVGGTLTVHTSLPLNPDRVVALKCNSTTAVLDLAPGNVVDFGPVDLDITPTTKTKTVTLKNTGAAMMNIGAVSKTTTGPFTFTATPTAAVGPNGTYSFDVTYTPTAERAPNQPETATVVVPLTGAIGTPGSATVMISGYGVDRHIGVAPAPVFPNTFKNPGDKAPILPVTITNNGDANLNVSAVMLSDAPIWTITNPDPVDVSGRQSYEFLVKFEPVTAGKAPTGHMVIMNNDNGKPVVSVDLDGIALDRLVEFGPNEINLGYVGIGISTRLSEAGVTLEATPTTPVLSLDVTNHEMTEQFELSAMTITGGDGAFRVLDLTDDHEIGDTETMQLTPQSTHKFDVVFTPTHEGDFVADVNLFLDNADTSHSTVRLRGRGLYVDVRGGGGCSTGGNSGGGALLLVLGALLVGRRRKARGLLGLIGVVGAASAAHAETRNLDTTLFDPTPATQVTALQSQSADVGKDGDYAISALLTYADNPLVLGTSQNTYTAVDNRSVLVLGGAYAFGTRFEAGLRMPLLLQNGQATGEQNKMFQVVQVDSVTRGDATVHAKMNGGALEALGGDLSYGGAFALSIPTRSGSEFAGTNMPQARLLGLATLTKGRLVLQMNAGAIIRSKDRYSSLVQRSGGTFAVGGTWRAANKVWIGGEVFGNLIPGGKTGDPEGMEMYGPPELSSSIEGLAELTYRMSRTATLGVALGRGITSGVGTSNARGALMLSFTPGADAVVALPKKIHIEGPNDKDGDGVKDKLDACPNEAEDKDLFEDGDGCPDVDNDNDGISDEKDKCALDAEDRDRFEDEDGCPERDNDNDGVADDQDKCPVAAEDKDGFQDTDGCAEADNDNDGLVDKADKCPNEPESINGNADDDGCPDRGDALVVLSPDRLDLLDNILFEGGAKIARGSKNILSQIGATLRAHPELLRIRLTAHVQPTGNPKNDLALSEARAKAVREWLVDWGIDPLRLQSSGFGSSKPLVDPKSKGAREINDRFELIVLERK